MRNGSSGQRAGVEDRVFKELTVQVVHLSMREKMIIVGLARLRAKHGRIGNTTESRAEYAYSIDNDA